MLATGVGTLLISAAGATATSALASDVAEQTPATPGSGVFTVRELPELRTADSDTFLRSDGSRALHIYANPVNYQVVENNWQPINDALTESSDGTWEPTASPEPISLPSSLAGGSVVIGPSGSHLSLALQEANPGTTSVEGVQRTYADVRPDVTAAFAASSESVRETLTLASAAAPTVYHYSLGLSSGLHADLSPSGGVSILDAQGNQVYWLATPTVSDSSTTGQMPLTAPVHYELSSDGKALTLTLDKAWLSNPARVFPVKIDPDTYFTKSEDCSIAGAAYANTSLCGDRLYVGPNSESPKSIARGLLHFNVSSIPKGSVIMSSRLELDFETDTTSSPLEIEAYGLTRGFTNAATWNTYDGTHSWTTTGGDIGAGSVGETTVLNSWKGSMVYWGFSPEVEQWVQEPSSNYGILLKAKSETVSGYDTFVQSENCEGDPEPALEVLYEPRLGYPPAAPMVQESLGYGGVMAVNAANGNLNVNYPDVKYATSGYETGISRIYNSEDDELSAGSFGDNWRMNMGEDTLLYPSFWDGSYYFHQGDGFYTRFDAAPWANGHPSAGDDAFTGEPNVTATLVAHENGTRTLTYNASGVEWQFDNSGAGFPQKIVDPGGEGNTISLAYTESLLTKVTDTHEHALTLTRNKTTSYVTSIKSNAGLTWKYTYNGTTNRLEAYEGPEGQKEEFRYASGGYLEAIIESAGTWVISYDSVHRVSSLRKVVNGTLTIVGSSDEITTFSYGSESTTAHFPSGTETVYAYNVRGEQTEDAVTQEAATTFYSGYAGLTSTVAAADVELQDRADGLDSELSQQLGGSFLGEWFDSTSGRVKVGISAGAYEQTVRQDLNNLGIANKTDIVNESHSWEQLETAKESLVSALSELVTNGLVQLELIVSSDSVRILVANDLTSAQHYHVSEVAAGATVPTEIVEEPVKSLAFEEASAKCEKGRCGAPLRGGVEIETLKVTCTAGFIAKGYSGKPYVMTAGHCIYYGGGPGEFWSGSFPGDKTYNDRYIGTASSYVFSTHNNISGTKSEGDMGLIEIASGDEFSQPIEPFVLVYGSPAFGTIRNEEYPIFGTHYNPQTLEKQQQFVVCTGGVHGETHSGNEHCGITEGNYGSVPYHGGLVVRNMERFQTCNKAEPNGIQNGQSGSPVYKNHKAYGILSGSEGQNPCIAVYEGINTAESVLKVHVVTGG